VSKKLLFILISVLTLAFIAWWSLDSVEYDRDLDRDRVGEINGRVR